MDSNWLSSEQTYVLLTVLVHFEYYDCEWVLPHYQYRDIQQVAFARDFSAQRLKKEFHGPPVRIESSEASRLALIVSEVLNVALADVNEFDILTGYSDPCVVLAPLLRKLLAISCDLPPTQESDWVRE